MVNYSIDEAIVSKADIARDVEKLLQSKLDQIDSGITVVAMEVSDRIIWPRKLDEAFEGSINAKQQAQQAESDARAYAERTINEAGGRNAEKILAELKNPTVSEKRKESQLSQLAGKAEEIIAEARAYRTKVVKAAEADAEYLKKLLPEYQKRPKLVLKKIYLDALTKVMDSAEEKIFIQPSISGKPKELRVLITKEPKKLEPE